MSDVQTELTSAEVLRDKLRERAAWWEDHKELVVLPSMMGGLVGGYFTGMGVAAVAALPELANWFGSVFGLVLVGQWIQRYYNPRKLVAAQKRVDALREKIKQAREQAESE